MKIGMIGLPQVGKKTLFELLTAHKPTEAEIVSLKPIKGVAEILDGRFDSFQRIIGMSFCNCEYSDLNRRKP